MESGMQFFVQRMDHPDKYPAVVLAIGRDVDMAILQVPALDEPGCCSSSSTRYHRRTLHICDFTSARTSFNGRTDSSWSTSSAGAGATTAAA